ncbi:MAG: PAS domain S-box protein [Pseudomonadota bacterium]
MGMFAMAAEIEALISGLPDALVVIDAETATYVAVNEAACRIVGRTRDEMMAHGPVALANDPSFPVEVLKRRYQDLVDSHPRARMQEARLVLPDGSDIAVEYHRHAMQLEGRWVVVVRTVELAMQHQPSHQASFRNVLDLSSDAVALLDARLMKLVDVNQCATQLLGYTREEFLERGLLALLGDVTQNRFATLVQELIAQAPQARVVDTSLRRKDGRDIPVQVTQQAVDDHGRWIVVVTARDITERVEARRTLERFRAAMDQSADALVLLDRERMKVLDANATALRRAGMTREDYLSSSIWEQEVDGSPGKEERAFDDAIAAAPETLVRELMMKGADGATFPAEVSRRAIRIDGRWIIVMSSRDITERKRADEERQRHVNDLARSNHELERFAYVASHDLMEPLRMVGSYTQLLERRYRDRLDDDAREFIGFIVSGAQRMRSLLEDLLSYARVGRLQRKPGEVALDKVLDDALANLKVLIAEKGALIERGPLPVVHCERGELMQLLQNLVGNALKFQEAGRAPVVRVAAAPNETGWTFSVEDNGIGIAPEYFERIFVVFQRLHARESYSGTGIGLAICKKIVESHGGRIWVDSQPGAGTTFHFTLPRVPPTDTGTPGSETRV